MKIYQCGGCSQLIYFESVHCVSCKQMLGFFPDLEQICAMQQDSLGYWQPVGVTAPQRYKQCYNYRVEQVCNWMVAEQDEDDFCLSCRLNEVIPNLDKPDNRKYWQKLEIAKRRLVYGLLQLKLPLSNKKKDPEKGLAFKFLMNPEVSDSENEPILIGHDAGLITMNVAEADDAYREKARLNMHERYRTLLGHFRHESGHYYWFRLLQEGPWLEEFRLLFGDEQADYGEALKTYYAQGPKLDWQQTFITRYASAHPWEDWAETWAHYLHMHHGLETAHAWGVTLNPQPEGMQSNRNAPLTALNYSFESMCDSWAWLSCALNSLNRSMGMADMYPFTLNDVSKDKLRFVHRVVHAFQETAQNAF